MRSRIIPLAFTFFLGLIITGLSACKSGSSPSLGSSDSSQQGTNADGLLRVQGSNEIPDFNGLWNRNNIGNEIVGGSTTSTGLAMTGEPGTMSASSDDGGSTPQTAEGAQKKFFTLSSNLDANFCQDQTDLVSCVLKAANGTQPSEPNQQFWERSLKLMDGVVDGDLVGYPVCQASQNVNMTLKPLLLSNTTTCPLDYQIAWLSKPAVRTALGLTAEQAQRLLYAHPSKSKRIIINWKNVPIGSIQKDEGITRRGPLGDQLVVTIEPRQSRQSHYKARATACRQSSNNMGALLATTKQDFDPLSQRVKYESFDVFGLTKDRGGANYALQYLEHPVRLNESGQWKFASSEGAQLELFMNANNMKMGNVSVGLELKTQINFQGPDRNQPSLDGFSIVSESSFKGASVPEFQQFLSPSVTNSTSIDDTQAGMTFDGTPPVNAALTVIEHYRFHLGGAGKINPTRLGINKGQITQIFDKDAISQGERTGVLQKKFAFNPSKDAFFNLPTSQQTPDQQAVQKLKDGFLKGSKSVTEKVEDYITQLASENHDCQNIPASPETEVVSYTFDFERLKLSEALSQEEVAAFTDDCLALTKLPTETNFCSDKTSDIYEARLLTYERSVPGAESGDTNTGLSME